jgi:hypothetical protein
VRSPITQRSQGLGLGQTAGCLSNLRGHPAGVGDDLKLVSTRRGVPLAQRRQSVGLNAGGHSNERRPEASMDVGDLATQDTADQNFGPVADRAREPEDFATLRVPPPTPANRLASNGFSEIRYRSSPCFEHHSVSFDEAPSCLTRHCARRVCLGIEDILRFYSSAPASPGFHRRSHSTQIAEQPKNNRRWDGTASGSRQSAWAPPQAIARRRPLPSLSRLTPVRKLRHAHGESVTRTTSPGDPEWPLGS